MALTTEKVHAQTITANTTPLRTLLSNIVVIFKLRIVVLLLAAAWGGAMLASSGRPDGGALLLLTITGALAAGGSGALNQYLERHKDYAMKRTRRRPLVTGQIHARWVLVIGSVMVAPHPFT